MLFSFGSIQCQRAFRCQCDTGGTSGMGPVPDSPLLATRDYKAAIRLMTASLPQTRGLHSDNPTYPSPKKESILDFLGSMF